VTRLVLVNGAPASGKSTLARRFANDHPLTLVLDLDLVRGLLGRWLETPVQAGQLARAMALEMARVHLAAGHDVIVPQFLGRLDFVLALEQLCEEVGAVFIELVLLSTLDEAVDRFVRRSKQSGDVHHQDAAALVERDGGAASLRERYQQLLEVVAARPGTRAIRTVDGEIDQAYESLLAQL
jgi:predicted kinase